MSYPWLKPATFILSLAPFSWCLYQVLLLAQGQQHSLGADPGKAIVLYNGEWALRFLILTLMVTPMRQLLSIPSVARVRRMLGLFTFFYATLHVVSYAVFLLELQFTDILADIIKRPYITVGFAAFLLLVPLAVTSNRWMISRLKKRWKILHKLIYLIAILVILHLTWLTKDDYQEVFFYAMGVALLLGIRAWWTGWTGEISLIPLRRKTVLQNIQKF
jgi:methionine sulfoxide reductase heme-binding subunit